MQLSIRNGLRSKLQEWVWIFALVAILIPQLVGQPAEDISLEKQLEVLDSLMTAGDTQQAEVQRIRNELAVAQTGPEREALEEALKQQTANLEEIRKRFAESASGVESRIFEEHKEEDAFSWEQTLGKILEPILMEVEKVTAGSRKRTALEEEYRLFSERSELAAAALERLDTMIGQSGNPELDSILVKQRKLWDERMVLSENRARAAALQLEEMAANDPGWLGGTTTFIRQFLAVRGLNLIYGILAAMAVFFGVRYLLAVLQRIRKGSQAESFANRVFLLMTNLLSIVGAVAALLIAFSAVGDLFLLGIVLIILIGAAWAGIQVIPQFIESIKLILNIGMVREKQRLLFDGIPWTVESLGFSCVLVNEELDNGTQTLPVRRLVGLHSRPWCDDESAFPVRRGDWIQLSDGTMGESIAQNPGTVTLREWGGAERTYKTVDFLDLAPRNLSRNGFRVCSLFGIDYAHQAVATTSVPGWFEASLREHLPKVIDPELVVDISVLFAAAAASSLDFEIRVSLKGEAAGRYRDVELAIQRILVDSCNAHQLTIPFQQVTVHQAVAGAVSSPRTAAP